MFDLNYSPLHLSAGRELAELPGLIAVPAPRRAARHRSGELLVALLNLSSAGDGRLLPTAQTALVDAYFATAGTVTAAMRAVLQQLNELLLTTGGVQAALSLAIIHEGTLFIAQAGPSLAVLVNRGAAQAFTDSSAETRLGAAASITPRFFQASLATGDLLLLSPALPPGWTPENFAHAADLESLRRRLMAHSPANLCAALVQVVSGSGKVQRAQLKATEEPAKPQPLPPEVYPAAAITPSRTSAESAPLLTQPSPALTQTQPLSAPPTTLPAPSTVPESQPLLAQPTPSARPRASQPPPAAITPVLPGGGAPPPVVPPLAAEPARADRPRPAQPALASPDRPAKIRQPADRPWMRRLAAVLRGARSTQAGVERGLGSFVPKLLPGAANQPYSISPATMFFIAVAIPAIIVAIATTVYLRSGATEQRIAFLQQARVYAEQAAAQEDTTQRHADWTQVIYWVKKAEEYGQDDETRALRFRAQTALDSIDGIARLSLTPAFSGLLGADLNITRIIAGDAELYLLDSTNGRVLRLLQVGSDYELDPSFNCGPGPSGGGRVIGALVAAAALPLANEHNASLVAIDKTGNLLYCIPGEAPLSAALSPPENNWGQITAMTIQDGDLFVLDPINDGVHRYDGVNYGFGDLPRLFFGNQVPDLARAIDLANYGDDLYILRDDGTIILCTYSDFATAPTRCADPAPYGDARSEASVDHIPDTHFVSLVTTTPPDPSLYILDANGPAVYHFSLRLNLQRQYRQDTTTDFPLPRKPVTAFTITDNREVFLAFGNQVFYGALP